MVADRFLREPRVQTACVGHVSLCALPGAAEDNLVKLLLEILVAIILHPIAVVLAWINLAGRADLTAAEKVIWGIVCLVWGIGPILYILLGRGQLWGTAPQVSRQ